MIRPPTYQEAEEISGILLRTHATANSVQWVRADQARAMILVNELYGKGTAKISSGCMDCHFDLLDNLRAAINLPRGRPAQDVRLSLQERRLSICSTCPAYRPKTESCGRLILDAISPQPIDIDGEPVNPCGCHLPTKVKFKHATCPARRWPIP